MTDLDDRYFGFLLDHECGPSAPHHGAMDANRRAKRPGWHALPAQPQHIVYELGAYLPDWNAAPVYTGVTSNLNARLRSHREKWWWQAVDPDTVTLWAFPTRDLANRFETIAIARNVPAMNRAGRVLTVQYLDVR